MATNKAIEAANYLGSMGLKQMALAQECLATCAIENNMIAARHLKILDKIFRGERVANEAAIDLAGFLKKMFDEQETEASAEAQSGR